MWSLKHTGYQGVVKDSYQRICLRLTAHEFLEPLMFNKVHDLVAGYMLRHVLLEIDLNDPSLDYHHLGDNCAFLKDLTLPEEKIIFTCEVANYERDNPAIKRVLERVEPTVVLLKRCATRNKTLAMIKYLALDIDNVAEEVKNKELAGDDHKRGPMAAEERRNIARGDTRGSCLSVRAKAPVIPVVLGASCLPDEEKQFFLDAQRGTVRAMCLGPTTFPNLLTCLLDLLHTRECNAYVTIDSFDEDHIRGLGKFMKKYNKSAPAVVVKALLQLGAVVCVDRSLIDHEGFYNDILRLAHPFTHMQTERAPADEFSFIIPPDELEWLVENSQEVELLEERGLIEGVYTGMPAVRSMGV